MGDKWDMDEAYPPILWKDYPPLVRNMTAEWLRCAGLRCDDEHALNELADSVGAAVIKLLKNRGLMHVMEVDYKHVREEGE